MWCEWQIVLIGSENLQSHLQLSHRKQKPAFIFLSFHASHLPLHSANVFKLPTANMVKLSIFPDYIVSDYCDSIANAFLRENTRNRYDLHIVYFVAANCARLDKHKSAVTFGGFQLLIMVFIGKWIHAWPIWRIPLYTKWQCKNRGTLHSIIKILKSCSTNVCWRSRPS